MDGQIDGQMDKCTVSFCILLDITPSGLLPCLLQKCHCNIDRLGKVATGHVMPLGDWFNDERGEENKERN